MNRVISLRCFVAAALLLPMSAIVGLSWRADAQFGGMRIEKIWYCSKCGGNLGNGVTPPPTCPRCHVKLRAPAQDNWDFQSRPSKVQPVTNESSKEGWSPGRFFAVFIGVAVLAGLGFYVLKDWGD